MIRNARIEDLKAINDLGNLVSNTFSKSYNVASYLENNKYIILVYLEENIVKGFILVYKNIDYYELEMIVVDINSRSRGIGTKLLKYFEDNYLQKDDVIFLEVAVNNENALKLYQKFGYEIINIRKKYYQGIDANIMKKVIK